MYFTINIALADPPCEQLIILSSKIQNQNFLHVMSSLSFNVIGCIGNPFKHGTHFCKERFHLLRSDRLKMKMELLLCGYSTVTDFAKFLGLSMSQPISLAA